MEIIKLKKQNPTPFGNQESRRNVVHIKQLLFDKLIRTDR